ncbi:GNAT family acetyltransferase [Pontibacillus halophilus JSM 076056 = DSM 19796]|uniref:GNAT family acetyltransferase n=1 Tax=Pontibacillus halophilus JSM 076056 = DSM 19796 TaxID=1385510 RepID=A0A0A5I8E7_9BACI|nr:GNAT family N-acetyltransferase [Pontibacillus halophilus]KGX92112.1 GNAT family acetyltransferase [Pontibacillus halophilus JSM 076056 = DSM 19796]
MKVRKLYNEDLELLTRLYVDVFSREPWSEPWTVETASKRIKDIQATPGYVGVGVIDYEEELNGMVLGNIEQWVDSQIFYVNELCVKKELEGQGVGSRLMQVLQEELMKQDVCMMYLSTERGHAKPAKFFEKLGFNIIEDRILMDKAFGS